MAVLNPNDRKMKTLLREKKLQAAAVNPDDDFCKLDERDMWRRAQRVRERAREGLHEHVSIIFKHWSEDSIYIIYMVKGLKIIASQANIGSSSVVVCA